MGIQFANNCATRLAANISAVDTSLTVATGTGARFPTVLAGSGNWFVVTLQNSAGVYELVRVDYHPAGSDTLGSVTYPLQRAYWDSATNPAAAWTSTDCVVDLRPVAQVMASFSSGMYGVNNLSDVSSAATSRTNLGISAVNTPFTATGGITATDTQNAVAGVDAALTTHKSAAGAHAAPNITYGGSTNIPAGTVDSALNSVSTSLGNKQPLNATLTDLSARAVGLTNATDIPAKSNIDGRLNGLTAVAPATNDYVAIRDTSGATDAKALVSDLLALSGGGAYKSVQVFTTPGSSTYTAPAGVARVKVTVVGGGGGGGAASGSSYSAAAGGAGGTAIKTIAAASLGATATVTVGGGGSGAVSSGSGSTGGTSSFGAFCSATGGTGGGAANTATGGAGGTGTGGDINLTGGMGSHASSDISGGQGGASYLGGGSHCGYGANAPAAPANSGAGGGGAGNAVNGGAGGSGIVIVEEFF